MDKKKLINIVILIAFALGALILGFTQAKMLGVGLFEEKVHEVNIKSESDIIAMGGSFYNNVCELENDVVLYESEGLASKDHPFVGVFDGNGNTITVFGNIRDSIFGYIGEGGVVKNLNIVIQSAEFTDKASALLAIENAGTIIDCKITVQHVNIKSTGNFGGVVSSNKGVIKNVVVDAKFENSITESNSRRTVIGGICAYNYGVIESCISEVSYVNYSETVKENIFTGSAVNTSIGAVVGINNGEVKGSIAIVSDDTYTSDNKNNNITFATDRTRAEVFSSENIFDRLGFKQEMWTYVNGEFIIMQGE